MGACCSSGSSPEGGKPFLRYWEVSQKVQEKEELKRAKEKEMLSLLDATEPFKELSKAQRKELLLSCEWIQLSSKVTLFDVGDVADAIYIVISGSVKSIKKSNGAERVFLKGV